MQIKFKKLHPDAVMPKQGTPGSAGFDLFVRDYEHTETSYGNYMIRYYSGIAVEIPKGYVGLVFPRSSICNTAIRLTNAVGVIDSDYRGEITGVFDAAHGILGIYEIGMRFAQLVIVPIPEVEYIEVDNLSVTERGAGGYGSTGK